MSSRNPRALIYLMLVVFTLSCLCATFNVLAYGTPVSGRVGSVLGSSTTLLVVASLVLASVNGIVSNLIANWVLERIDVLPSRQRAITKMIVVIVFVISLGLGILFAVVLK